MLPFHQHLVGAVEQQPLPELPRETAGCIQSLLALRESRDNEIQTAKHLYLQSDKDV